MKRAIRGRCIFQFSPVSPVPNPRRKKHAASPPNILGGLRSNRAPSSPPNFPAAAAPAFSLAANYFSPPPSPRPPINFCVSGCLRGACDARIIFSCSKEYFSCRSRAPILPCPSPISARNAFTICATDRWLLFWEWRPRAGFFFPRRNSLDAETRRVQGSLGPSSYIPTCV